MDVGYSNLKVAYGRNETPSPKTILRPAGAAPEDRFGSRLDGKDSEEFLRVVVNGKKFIAGVSPDRAQMWSRSLHAEYSSSESYQALFKAGLLLAGMEQIDMLVTGLPVLQYLDEQRKKSLINYMTGIHEILPGKIVDIKKVKVVSQPIGGFLDFISRSNEDIEDASILVIDPGFFSVDWVVISNDEIHKHSSGTSLTASSVLLEEASALISKDHGTGISAEMLENAIRQNKTTIMVLGQRIEIAPYLRIARKSIGPVITEEIQKSLRNENKMVDIVVMVGGGATFFMEAVKEAFPRLKILLTQDAVFSNCRGFWMLGAASE
ncbi:MAG TPA: hypothetical protein DEF07_01365 [Nitrosomonas sp.]|nr:hypothetical protein [Nitrosomonas sp.]